MLAGKGDMRKAVCMLYKMLLPMPVLIECEKSPAQYTDAYIAEIVRRLVYYEREADK
jgi:hypothetical protein